MTTYRAWADATPPGSVNPDNSPYTLGLCFAVVEDNCTFTGWWWWAAADVTLGPRLFDTTDGSLVASADGWNVYTAGDGSPQWQYYAAPEPIPLVNGRQYIAGVRQTENKQWYTATTGVMGHDTEVGPLYIPQDTHAYGNNQCPFRADGADAMPNLVYNSSNYWLDVEITQADAGADATGTGGLTLTGAASATVNGAGSAGLSLTGAATAHANATGTGGFTLSAGTAAAITWATGTAGVDLEGTGTTNGYSGTGGLTLTGTGTAHVMATGTGSLFLSGGSAPAECFVTGSGGLTLTGVGHGHAVVISPYTLWNGTYEEPLTMAVWDGTAEQPIVFDHVVQ